jgi:hypothetical protein
LDVLIKFPLIKTGAIGLPAQIFKGTYEEIRNIGKQQNNEHIEAILLAQGEEELKTCSTQEQKIVVEGWYEAMDETGKRGGVKYQ